MRVPFKLTVVSGVLIVVAAISILVFQNCAKAKFNDPDTRYSMMSMGLCQECGNASGRGLSCRSSKEDPFPACVIESCNPGYKFEDFSCIPVVCTPNSVANCTVPHGEGRMTCNSNGRGYGACMAMDCETGYTLASGACVAVAEPENPTPTPSPTLSPTPSLTPSPAPEESPTPTTPTPSVTPSPAPVCVPETHRDCSTDSTYGTQTCNSEGSGYGDCVLGECKAGYNNQDGGDCVANLCEPGSVTPCTLGAGTGFKTCNSQGAGWGTCAINGCQQGYILQNGVCTVQVCTPGQQTVCEFANGSGVKTCNQEGSDYGSCTLLGCQKGYFLVGNQCLDQKCVPSSQDTCVGESGTGVMYCYENGQGHGPCQLTSCDPGFKLKGGQCVSADSCDAGETEACTQQFGTGIRTCNTNSHKLGPCELTACNPGYQLVNQNGNACKKIN